LQGLTLVVLCWFRYIVARGKFGSWAFVGLDRRIPPDLGAARPQTPQARALRGPLQPAPKGGPVGAMRPKRAPLWKPPILAAHGEGRSRCIAYSTHLIGSTSTKIPFPRGCSRGGFPKGGKHAAHRRVFPPFGAGWRGPRRAPPEGVWGRAAPRSGVNGVWSLTRTKADKATNVRRVWPPPSSHVWVEGPAQGPSRGGLGAAGHPTDHKKTNTTTR
jgi:hypothetical protein